VLPFSARAQSPNRPLNIVLILVDDLGWRDLGCYGRGDVFHTPNIDRLASQGMRFTQAYANCPVCSPSRAALLTGKDPARLQFTGHITATGQHRHPENSRIIPPDDYLFLRREEITLAEALKPAGYVSASIGKWHLGKQGHWPEDQGFDVNVAGWTHGSPPSYFYPYEDPNKDWNPSIPTLKGGKPGEYLTDRLTDEAIQFIEDSQERPFFLYLSHYAPHTPLQAPEELVNKYKDAFAGRETGVDPTYAAMVEKVDESVGRVLDTLDRLALAENTVVVFFSDNGGAAVATTNAPLRESKSWLYEGGIRVPLILRWPGKVQPDTVCKTPVIGTDLFPTLLNAAGIRTDPNVALDGMDLAPLWDTSTLWNGSERFQNRSLYWYYPHYSTSQQPGAAIRKSDWKYIEFYDPWKFELYDLATDPREQKNLAYDNMDLVIDLKSELVKHFLKVGAKKHHVREGHD
jgi:arylsulfatase A-like enzyme